MKTNNSINNLREERALAKVLRVFYIIAAVIYAAGIIFLICNKLWQDLCWGGIVLAFTITAACDKSEIIDLCTRTIDTADDLDTNLENAKREEIE